VIHVIKNWKKYWEGEIKIKKGGNKKKVENHVTKRIKFWRNKDTQGIKC
jgi:hypothetical protein